MDEDLKKLADEVSTALADLVEAAQEGHANTGEISTTLAEMLEVLKARKESQIVVHAPPAQVTVMPAPAGDFDITHQYDKAGRLVTSHVRRIAKGESQ